MQTNSTWCVAPLNNNSESPLLSALVVFYHEVCYPVVSKILARLLMTTSLTSALSTAHWTQISTNHRLITSTTLLKPNGNSFLEFQLLQKKNIISLSSRGYFNPLLISNHIWQDNSYLRDTELLLFLWKNQWREIKEQNCEAVTWHCLRGFTQHNSKIKIEESVQNPATEEYFILVTKSRW